MDTVNISAMLQENVASLCHFLPELVLVAAVPLLFIVDLLTRKSARRAAVVSTAAMGFLLVAAVLSSVSCDAAPRALFNGLLAYDGLALFFKWIFFCATGLGIYFGAISDEIALERKGEYFSILLAICLGLCLMASSVDLLMLYLSMELVSLGSYLLAGYRRADRRAAEGAIKYVIYGGVSSGLMLFGISYLYGLLGTTELSAIAKGLVSLGGASTGTQLALFSAVVFVLCGLGYKIAAVPWHMWCPDVYEGSPTPFTAFLSVAPKAAGFALAIRFFGAFTPQVGEGLASAAAVPWMAVLGLVALVTMTLGNLAALNQSNMKRLLAYSSIAHAGYLLMGLAAGSEMGNTSVLVYLIFYVLMNLGAFFVVEAVARATGGESIQDYRGLVKRAPFLAIVMAIFLFSLTGIPPLAGFIGKFYLFYAVVERASGSAGIDALGWWSLGLAGALNSAVALFYYARVVKAMFLERATTPAGESPLAIQRATTGVAGALAFLVLMLGVFFSPIVESAQAAVQAIYRG